MEYAGIVQRSLGEMETGYISISIAKMLLKNISMKQIFVDERKLYNICKVLINVLVNFVYSVLDKSNLLSPPKTLSF